MLNNKKNTSLVDGRKRLQYLKLQQKPTLTFYSDYLYLKYNTMRCELPTRKKSPFKLLTNKRTKCPNNTGNRVEPL